MKEVNDKKESMKPMSQAAWCDWCSQRGTERKNQEGRLSVWRGAWPSWHI